MRNFVIKFFRSFFTYFSFVLAGSFCGILLVEAAARVYFTFDNRAVEPAQFWRSSPLPYKNAPYYNDEFVTELVTLPQKIFLPEGTRLVLLHDLKEKFHSIVDGLRVTSDQPRNFNRRILLFGSSTVFGRFTPDEYTITSYLQRMVNTTNQEARVENLGFPTVRAFQQLDLLKMIGISPWDIVIFFDGASDIYHGVYLKEPSDAFSIRADGFRAPIEKKFLKILAKYKDKIFISRFLFNLIMSKDPDHLNRDDEVVKLTAQTTKAYEATIKKAYEYTVSAGAKFFHIIQPNIFTQDPLSQYEVELLENYLMTPSGMDVAFRQGNISLGGTSSRLEKYGIKSFNFRDIFNQKKNYIFIRDIFNQKKNKEEYYLDFIHIAHLGNAIIANNIFQIIEKDLDSPLVESTTETRKNKFGIPKYILDARG